MNRVERQKRWTIEFGGENKAALLTRLTKHSVGLNAYAVQLFMNDKFTTSPKRKRALITKVSVSDLGFSEGALYSDIVRAAHAFGLALCPLEVAPALRVNFLSQKPDVHLTLASAKLEPQEEYPNGFYLKRSNDLLWLRGYRATSDWIWDPEQQFAFMESLTHL